MDVPCEREEHINCWREIAYHPRWQPILCGALWAPQTPPPSGSSASWRRRSAKKMAICLQCMDTISIVITWVHLCYFIISLFSFRINFNLLLLKCRTKSFQCPATLSVTFSRVNILFPEFRDCFNTKASIYRIMKTELCVLLQRYGLLKDVILLLILARNKQTIFEGNLLEEKQWTFCGKIISEKQFYINITTTKH